ncbi:MAG: adenine phosphoribosyltransferase [Victivallaceae bacterium]|nr:adenine phosphoribosyltransferase [Victivallaceae bacterium]
MNTEKLAKALRRIPDFPHPGIIYIDITPILQNAELFRLAVDLLAKRHIADPPDYIAAVDARGFVFGGALALKLGCGFVPVRKKGKLPYKTLTEEYDLEYGSAQIEIHIDAIPAGAKVLLVDDLLATGGTAAAAVRLLEQLKARIIGIEFLIELGFLNGRQVLSNYPVNSLILEK